METITLAAGEDHIQKIAREADPVRAIIELIWNGLDADASKVTVSFIRNEAEGIVGVIVKDDGTGMSPERIRQDFSFIGNSWKRQTRVTSKGRPIHGKHGQGRLRVFALGTEITWTTVGIDTENLLQKSTISTSIHDRTSFTVSPATEVSGPTYTRVHAVGKDNLNRLDSDKALEKITAEFAIHLQTHPDIKIIYDGKVVDPTSCIDHSIDIPLEWTHSARKHEALLRIIEWKDIEEHSLHLCDERGIPVEEAPASPFLGFSYSAYLLWKDMHNHANEALLASMSCDESLMGNALKAIDDALDSHFTKRRSEKCQELVENWREVNTYPYSETPKNDEEKLERAAFDLVATTLHRHLPKVHKQQKLALGLLKDALRRNPDGIQSLLEQYLELSEDESEKLETLLTRTSLSQIIRATTDVTDRLDFLAALREIVFSDEGKGLVKERDHLHKILARESWVFGEEFNLMSSEIGLTKALEQHLGILGRSMDDRTPVLRPDGRKGRLDLMFSLVSEQYETTRHLVVELKAPSVVATQREADQIKSYARAIVDDPRFSDTKTRWDFILVVNDYDSNVRKDISQRGRQRGILDELETGDGLTVEYRVWVRKWSEIIEAAHRRLLYFKNGLQHDPSLVDAKVYLRRHHADALPQGFFEEATGESVD